MYKIGEFSNITELPIRTLRYYDEIGLLVPTTDRWTNYRLYTEENVEEAEYIKFLKSMDFKLEEIIAVKSGLDNNTIDAKINELAMKRDVIDYQIACLNTIKSQITDKTITHDNVVTLSKTMDRKVA